MAPAGTFCGGRRVFLHSPGLLPASHRAGREGTMVFVAGQKHQSFVPAEMQRVHTPFAVVLVSHNWIWKNELNVSKLVKNTEV